MTHSAGTERPTAVAAPGQPSGRRVRRGAWWGLGSQLAVQVLSMVSTLVLARLLLPEDFGIVAITTSIVGFVGIGLSLGWQPSVVRRPSIDDLFLSSLLWAAVGVALLAAGTTVLLAPQITALLGLPEATPYVRVLAIALVFHLARTVPLGLLLRAYRYRAQYIIDASGMTLCVAVEITLAASGAGAWSMIIGQLTMSAFLTVSAFTVARWVPTLSFSPRLLRGEVGFAGSVLSTQVATYTLKNVDYWIVGNVLGAASLGAYYVAYVLPTIVRMRLTKVADQVLLPVFAREDEPSRRRRIYREVVRLQIGLGFPAMGAIGVLAGPIVAICFGDKWAAAVAPMTWLSAVAAIDILGSVLAPVAAMCGGLPRLLMAQTLRLIVTAAGVALAASLWGTLQAVAVAVLLGALVGSIMIQQLVARHVGLPFRVVRRDVSAFAMMSVVMVLAMLLAMRVMHGYPSAVILLATAPAGLVAFVATGLTLFRDAFHDLLISARKMLRP